MHNCCRPWTICRTRALCRNTIAARFRDVDLTGFATHTLGTIPRCHAGAYRLGKPGESKFADSGVVCRRGGWLDGHESE